MEPGSVENLSIVYHSRDFLVVSKHWDVRIDSRAWRHTLTLQAQLRHRFPELADPDTFYGFRWAGVRVHKGPGRAGVLGRGAPWQEAAARWPR